MTTTRIDAPPHPHPGHDERVAVVVDPESFMRDALAGYEALKARKPPGPPVFVVHGDVTPAMHVEAARYGATVESATYEFPANPPFSEFARQVAKIPGMTEAEALAMAKRYNDAMRKAERAAQIEVLRECYEADMARRWRQIADLHDAIGKPPIVSYRSAFEAADPPPKPAPRGVCVGLALAGWAS